MRIAPPRGAVPGDSTGVPGGAALPSAFAACDAASREIICFRSGVEYSRDALAAWVEGLTRRVEGEGTGRWLVYNADALGAAVSMLALARAGGCAVMAPNAQAETLRRLGEGVHGALLEKDVPQAELGVKVFSATGAASEEPLLPREIEPAHRIAELRCSCSRTPRPAA